MARFKWPDDLAEHVRRRYLTDHWPPAQICAELELLTGGPFVVRKVSDLVVGRGWSKGLDPAVALQRRQAVMRRAATEFRWRGHVPAPKPARRARPPRPAKVARAVAARPNPVPAQVVRWTLPAARKGAPVAELARMFNLKAADLRAALLEAGA